MTCNMLSSMALGDPDLERIQTRPKRDEYLIGKYVDCLFIRVNIYRIG